MNEIWLRSFSVMARRGKIVVLWEKPAPLSSINPAGTCLGWNMGLRDERSATDRLSHGSSHYLYKEGNIGFHEEFKVSLNLGNTCYLSVQDIFLPRIWEPETKLRTSIGYFCSTCITLFERKLWFLVTWIPHPSSSFVVVFRPWSFLKAVNNTGYSHNWLHVQSLQK